jgi:hypothetical protein
VSVTALKPKRVLVCGGRDYYHPHIVARVLDDVRQQLGHFELIEGGARGADRAAREWAQARQVPYLTVEADWELHGKAAGPIRNRKMLRLQPDLVVAFPGGRGTQNMAHLAQQAGVQVWCPIN